MGDVGQHPASEQDGDAGAWPHERAVLLALLQEMQARGAAAVAAAGSTSVGGGGNVSVSLLPPPAEMRALREHYAREEEVAKAGLTFAAEVGRLHVELYSLC